MESWPIPNIFFWTFFGEASRISASVDYYMYNVDGIISFLLLVGASRFQQIALRLFTFPQLIKYFRKKMNLSSCYIVYSVCVPADSIPFGVASNKNHFHLWTSNCFRRKIQERPYVYRNARPISRETILFSDDSWHCVSNMTGNEWIAGRFNVDQWLYQ